MGILQEGWLNTHVAPYSHRPVFTKKEQSGSPGRWGREAAVVGFNLIFLKPLAVANAIVQQQSEMLGQ